MKKVRLFIFISFILILGGCDKYISSHKYYDTNISKIGHIELLTLEEIIEKHNLSKMLKYKNIRETIGYTNHSDLKKIRIEFYIKFDNNEFTIQNLILNPCSSKKSYNVLFSEYPEKLNLIEDPYGIDRGHFYIDIEKLKELGYITKNREEQEDLCLFEEWAALYGELIYTKKHYKSNKLVYKAEEINSIVEAYEATR